MTVIQHRDVVTIDGPSGVGKTAVARELARALGWRWVSAGMLYRAMAASGSGTPQPRVEFVAGRDNGEDPVVRVGQRRFGEDDLRSADLGASASQLAADPAVRSTVHRALAAAAGRGLVLEGRAMHRVAPGAARHFYLWADAAQRAARTAAIGERLDADRDARDSRRDHDPLRVRSAMTVWNSTRFTLPQTVAALARRCRVALGLVTPAVAVLSDGAPVPPRPPDGLDLRPVAENDAAAVEEALRVSDFGVVVARGTPCPARSVLAHVEVLIAGNDLVTVGPAAFGLAGMDRNLTTHPDRGLLAARGSVGFTCDVMATQDRAGRAFPDWWSAAANGARWVFVPAARPDPPHATVVHLRRRDECDAVLDRLGRHSATGGATVVVDHVGVPALALLAQAACPGGAVHVVGPDWCGTP